MNHCVTLRPNSCWAQFAESARCAQIHRRFLALATFVAFVSLVQSACSTDSRQGAAETKEWELVRSVENPYGGTYDLVVIPDHRIRERSYYEEVANVICGVRTSCVVFFWTDKAHIPRSAHMPVTDLAVMTADYERSPSYEGPHLRLACWLYPNKEVAEREECVYMPGADIPWK